jgi:hypothetical protein
LIADFLRQSQQAGVFGQSNDVVGQGVSSFMLTLSEPHADLGYAKESTG